MKPIYTSWKDLTLNKQGSVNLNSLRLNQKQSYREAIESVLAFGDFKSLKGKTTLSDLTPADRVILEQYMLLGADGVFYGEHQDYTPVTIQIQLPFMGFYESYHTEQPYEIMERELSDKAETITDENHDDFLRIFHTEFDYKKYHQKIACLYAHWLIHSLYDVTIADVELHCPREYNFTTDTITVTVNATLEQLDLTLDYFKCNPIDNDDTLFVETLAYIKEKYTSRDGFVSFVKSIPPTPESVFIEPAYRDCAFELYTYHKFDMEYWNDNYRHLLNELDEQFIDYMQEQGHYDDLFWDCLPKDLADYLNGDTP